MRLASLVKSATVLFIITTSITTKAQIGAQQEIQRFGSGSAQVLMWSPDGQTLALGGSLGVALYTPDLKLITTAVGNDAEITSLAWSPTGKQIATISEKRTLQLWTVASGTRITLAHTISGRFQSKNSLSYRPDGELLAVAGNDNSVYMWQSDTGKLFATLPIGGPVFTVVWHPDGSRLAIGARRAKEYADGLVQIWDTQTKRLVSSYDPQNDTDIPEFHVRLGSVQYVQWIATRDTLLVVDEQGHLYRWSLIKDRQMVEDEPKLGANDTAYNVRYSPDGENRAVATRNAGIDILIHTPNKSARFGSGGLVRALDWTPDSRLLALIDGEGAVFILDVRAALPDSEIKAAVTLHNHANIPSIVTWNADESRLIYLEQRTAIYDPEPPFTTVTIGDFLTREPEHTFTFRGFHFALSPDRKTIAYFEIPDVSPNRTIPARVMVKDLTKPGASRSLPMPPIESEDGPRQQNNGSRWPIGRLWWSNDGSRLFFSQGDIGRTVVIWDVATGTQITNFGVGNACLTVSPDLRYFTSCREGEKGVTLVIHDIATRREIGSWVVGEPDSPPGYPLWSNDGSRIAYEDTPDIDKRSTSIREIPTGKLIIRYMGRNLDTDGSRIAAIDPATETLRLYDFVTGKVSMPATHKEGGIQLANFSPDGKKLATAHLDGIIRVWDTTNLSVLALFSQETSKTFRLQWKPDGTQLLSWHEDRTLWLWKVST